MTPKELLLSMGFEQAEFGEWFTHPKLPGEYTPFEGRLDISINCEYHIKAVPCTKERIELLLAAFA